MANDKDSFQWITGASFAALRSQFINASGPDARLEVREEGKGLTFLVVDPDNDKRATAAFPANTAVDDTFTCPPICPKR